MPPVSINRLIALASRLTALTLDEIKGADRSRRFIRARMAIVHYAWAAGYTGTQIGRALGCRDHSTIFNLRDRALDWLGRDPLFDRIMDAMDDGIRNGMAAREVIPFVLPKTADKQPIDYIEIGDLIAKDRMRVGSEKLLQAMREAA